VRTPLIMPFRLCKTIDIENGHMLSKHPDKCRFPHGHTRKVEFVLEADSLDANDMVCDFKLIKEAVGDYLESLDHALCVNSADPACAELRARYGERIVVFPDQDPTTEVLAREIHRVAAERLAALAGASGHKYPLRAGVKLASVRVWETATSWAEFSEG
jgi:6-pyruvoyltetrahydropterin/6-carboxytetrahydropterin synthase